MRSRTRTIQKTDKFVISKRVRKGSGRVYYELACNMYFNHWSYDDFEKVRDIIDPTRNRAGQFGKSWKYQTRVEAEQALTHLLMAL